MSALRDDRPFIMGIVNVTADSFSDGGRYLAAADAIAHGRALTAAGADILDIGGESTRPGAVAIADDEQISRVVPVIAGLATLQVAISVDTTSANVAAAAIHAGATIVNDISGGRFDGAMWRVVDERGCGYVCGHLRGLSLAQVYCREEAITVEEVERELSERLEQMPATLRARTWIDPGLGFGKGSDPFVNLALLSAAGAMGRRLGRPALVGPSRKRFLRAMLGVSGGAVDDTAALDAATVQACLTAIEGGAQVVRVHDVAGMKSALQVFRRN